MRKLFLILLIISISFSVQAQFDSPKKKVNFSAMPEKTAKKKAIAPQKNTSANSPIKFESKFFKNPDDKFLTGLPEIPKVGEVQNPKTYELRDASENYTKKMNDQLKAEGLTSVIENRDFFYGEFKIFTKTLYIALRDYGAVDGDNIGIWVNGQRVVPVITLESGFKKYTFELKEGLNVIELEALNTGELFPNTGNFVFFDGHEKLITNQSWGLNEGYKAILKIVRIEGLEEKK